MSWAEITQSRVQAAGIVEALYILEQIASGIGAGSVNPVMNPLGLEVGEAVLGAGEGAGEAPHNASAGPLAV